MTHEITGWLFFGSFVLLSLALDLGIFHRKSHEAKIKEALLESAAWISLALLFNVWVFFDRGPDAAIKFLTGYLLEKSLSVDNLFIFLLIFSYFKVPRRYQHNVLFWGILGAVIMRAFFIGAGVVLIHRFNWVIYIFGAFLILTGIKLALEKDKEINPERNQVLRLFKKLMPVTHHYEENKFFIRQGGKLFATPLFVVLLVVESTDVVFAIDSIPAILGVTTDPFIVYTSNIFAILGLRALYFALSGIMELFHHLHYGLAVILVFIGIKMLGSNYFHIPVETSLGIIATVLALSVIASYIWPSQKQAGKE
ncbi:MAG: TerC family protein [Candidatus Omnitrophica bacterium]|nr:TerC family protein [Candidatus Omnitrophota bacterium]